MQTQHSPDPKKTSRSDSRAIWVEQTIIKDVCFPADNFPVGPGDYNAEPIRGHISTISYERPLQNYNRKSRRERRPNTTGSILSRQNQSLISDVSTHHVREDISTQKSDFLLHEPILHPTYYDGKRRIINGQMRERLATPVTQALPDYDIKYDSLQLRPKPRCGKFSHQPRPEIFPVYDPYVPPLEESMELRPWRKNSTRPMNIKVPRRKKLIEPSLELQSLARFCRPKSPIRDLNPAEIDRSIKFNIFSRVPIRKKY